MSDQENPTRDPEDDEEEDERDEREQTEITTSRRIIPNPNGGKGRSKIMIQYIPNDVVRRRVFHRRKAGLLKKLKELHTLTGSDMMLIMKPCNGSIISFATGDCENKVAHVVKELTDER